MNDLNFEKPLNDMKEFLHYNEMQKDSLSLFDEYSNITQKLLANNRNNSVEYITIYNLWVTECKTLGAMYKRLIDLPSVEDEILELKYIIDNVNKFFYKREITPFIQEYSYVYKFHIKYRYYSHTMYNKKVLTTEFNKLLKDVLVTIKFAYRARLTEDVSRLFKGYTFNYSSTLVDHTNKDIVYIKDVAKYFLNRDFNDIETLVNLSIRTEKETRHRTFHDLFYFDSDIYSIIKFKFTEYVKTKLNINITPMVSKSVLMYFDKLLVINAKGGIEKSIYEFFTYQLLDEISIDNNVRNHFNKRVHYFNIGYNSFESIIQEIIYIDVYDKYLREYLSIRELDFLTEMKRSNGELWNRLKEIKNDREFKFYRESIFDYLKFLEYDNQFITSLLKYDNQTSTISIEELKEVLQ